MAWDRGVKKRVNFLGVIEGIPFGFPSPFASPSSCISDLGGELGGFENCIASDIVKYF